MRRVCEALRRDYGVDRLGNPDDPLDDLLYVIISNKTSPSTAVATYTLLRGRFESWDDLLARCPVEELEKLMRHAGLARVKSQQILNLLSILRSDFGSCGLASLAAESENVKLAYLTSLPGVSGKVARCVMMYTLDCQVLPVDAHVHRIATRLGWTSRRRADQSHQEMEALIPPHRRSDFHVNCVQHGRLVCRPSDPHCEECSIRRHCQFAAAGA